MSEVLVVTMLVKKWTGRVIKAVPVNQLCKLEKLVFGIKDRFQSTPEQFIRRGLRSVRTHCHLTHCLGLLRVDHDPASKGIPYMRARRKSQGFG